MSHEAADDVLSTVSGMTLKLVSLTSLFVWALFEMVFDIMYFAFLLILGSTVFILTFFGV